MLSLKRYFTSRPYHFNDVKLILTIIPIIAAINYHLTYQNIHLNGFLIFSFLVDTQQGYVGWLCMRALILYLDRVYPYSRNTSRRIIIQTIGTTIVGDVAIIIQTMIMNYFFTDHAIPISFFTVDMVIISIWFLVLNGFYIGLHYYTLWQDAEALRKSDQAVRAEGYLVKYGKKNVSVPFNEIAGFTIKDDYAVLKTKESKDYYLDESLDSVETKLPPEFFFRLNRQYIIHRNFVRGFDRVENGKINVLVTPTSQFPDAISVSRLRAPTFKSWFQPE